MGRLTFSINVTLDGCVDHRERIADDETHAFFTCLMDEGGAMLWDESGLPCTRRLELVSATPLGNGAVAMHDRVRRA